MVHFELKTEDGSVGLDRPGDITYISHAHTDHVKGKNKNVIFASPETIDIGEIRFRDIRKPKGARLLRAGHMLGATQLKIQTDGGVLTYTGDLSLKDGFTFKGAEIEETDTLIVEATYGSPEFEFPEKEDVARRLREEVLSRLKHGIVIFGVYSRGKAQELIKMLNEFCGITPVVSDEIARISEHYVRHGVKLDYVGTSSPESEDLMRENFVGIIPKMMLNPFQLRERLSRVYRKPVYMGTLSGWTLKYPMDAYDIALPMSDHADFNDLLEYVEYANPKKVYAFGANATRFAGILSMRGYDSATVRE